jgi:NAD(P)H-hydrate epimerase
VKIKSFPKRSQISNKTDGGSVLIIAGGARFMGAGILSALAATRTGAGYTHLMTDLVRYPWIKFPDVILHKFGIQGIRQNIKSVIAIGPGLGVTKEKEKLLQYLIKNKIPKVVLDADALTILAKIEVKKLPSTWILTPHEGELARLLKVTSKKIKENREFFITEAQKKYGCVIVLKGYETLIADNQRIYKSRHASTALSKAGTGDVLLGIIAALYAQNLEPAQAAILGVRLHGEASKDWLKKGNDHLGLRPMDLVDQIPKTLLRLRKIVKN